jgi:hypothetical protein
MRITAIAGALALLLSASAPAADAAAPPDLNQTLTDVQFNDTLPAVLGQFSEKTGIDVVLDPDVERTMGHVRIEYEADARPARVVLGHVLRLAGGLRYAVKEGRVIVSSEGKLARQIASGTFSPEGVPAEASAMTVGDAVALTTDFTDEVHGVGVQKWAGRPWRAPYKEPDTGITQFPGPPVIIQGDDVGDRRFLFTEERFYVKPQYRGLVDPRLGDNTVIYKDDEARTDLNLLLRLIEENPEANASEILERYQKAQQLRP